MGQDLQDWDWEEKGVLRANNNKWLKVGIFHYFGRKVWGKGVNIVKKEKNAVEWCFVGGRIGNSKNTGDRTQNSEGGTWKLEFRIENTELRRQNREE